MNKKNQILRFYGDVQRSWTFNLIEINARNKFSSLN